ncbi:MAG: preprotein translocase subunit SecG [Thermodesulfobacteriota bacterium]
MFTFMIFFHIFVSIFMILTIIFQSGKGAGMGAVFGGASNQTLFGSAGPANLLSKLTAVGAIFFMVSSLYLAYFSAPKNDVSIIENLPIEEKQAPVDAPVEAPVK